MFTLTIDQKSVDGPKQAIELVQKRRSIPKLISKLVKLRILESNEYTVTLEFHENGWPHWHMLVDATFVCKYKLQAEWGLGNCWISKGDFDDVAHAINYATKYIVKTNDDENEDEFVFPEWVMDWKTNLRRFSASRSLSKKWSRKYNKKKPRIVNGVRVPEVKIKKEPRTRITKTGRQKIEGCGMTTNILERTEKVTTVKDRFGVQSIEHLETYRFVATLDVEYKEWFSTLTQSEINRLLTEQKLKDKEPLEEPKQLTPMEWQDAKNTVTVYRKLVIGSRPTADLDWVTLDEYNDLLSSRESV